MTRIVQIIILILLLPALFVGGIYVRFSPAKPLLEMRDSLRVMKEHLADVGEALRSHKAKHGEYPTNDEGLSVLTEFIATLPDNQPEHNFMSAPTGGNLYVLNGYLIMSPFDLPVMYENRSRLDATLFDDSPANTDPERRYSVKVDDDVYVYCIGAMHRLREYRELLRDTAKTIGTYFVILFVMAAIYFGPQLLARRRQGDKPRTLSGTEVLVFIVTEFVLLLIVVPMVMDGYRFVPYFRQPDMLEDYVHIIEKYKQCGVLKENTVTKIYQSFSKDDRDAISIYKETSE